MSPSLQWNPKVIVIGVLGSVLLLYAGSKYVLRKTSPSSSGINAAMDSSSKEEESSRRKDAGIKVQAADTQVDKAVPPGILEAPEGSRLSEVVIEEYVVELETAGKTVKIFYRETPGKKVAVLLLHGMAFKSQDWVDVGTIHMLSRMGHRVVAVDLPGFGKSKQSSVTDKGTFLQDFIAKLKLVKPVMVSPSMSGSFALPYIFKNSGTCQSKLSGYIPIAPVGVSDYAKAHYSACHIPVLIVFGDRDQMRKDGVNQLNQFANNKVFIVKDAGHPAWKHQPTIWNRALFNFMLLFEKA